MAGTYRGRHASRHSASTTGRGLHAGPVDASCGREPADAYVSRTKEHRNFGSSLTLRTTARPRLERSYLRFADRPLRRRHRARLRLYAATASRAGYAVRAIAAGGWAEGTIAYATAPAPGGIVATSGPVASDTWTSVDITGLVTNGAWGQMGAPVFYADASTPRYTWGAHCGAIRGK
jgi:hypothetical protein